MDSSIIATYYFLAQEITIYCGLFIATLGVFGGLLNVLVFTTLKTFRKTSCIFYLITASIVNVGQLLTSLLIRILAVGFHIDPTSISWICKIRIFSIQFCGVISLACMSLATIDQFMSLSKQHVSNLYTAHRNIMIACILITIHGIFFLIYYDTPNGVCVIINPNFEKYFSYFYFPVVLGFAPVTIMVTFASIAFYNTRTIASRRVHIERLSRDRQITAMVLVQVVFIVLLTVPYIICNIYTMSLVTKNELLIARLYLLNASTILGYYGSYSVSITFKERNKNVNLTFLSEFILCFLLCIKKIS